MRPVSPAPAVDLLRGDPSSIALCTETETVTYGELADQVHDTADRLGTTRRLVMIEARSTIGSLVSYLGAVTAGHPVLLVPGGDDEPAQRTRAALLERFDPDVIGRDGELQVRHEGSVHALHPDLALLMSTSGSTGSPKLVRLSADAVVANAESIADYLGLTADDRAITSLPLHYCYGLSVVHSHLLVGGSLTLTDRSISDDAFWAQAEAAGVTGIAGVPYSFELLDAVGGIRRLPASIRYVTQAGGRLPRERVQDLARAGRRQGFEFFTMYGQTEATARMSYLPAADAERAAGSIGRAIPGGSFRIDLADGADAGELVYTGPNVMMGYAETPADLALGRTVDELRTGDLARWRDDGYVEIVGRLNRFVKIFGLRIDLDAVQRELESAGVPARTAADEEELLVFVRGERDAVRAGQIVARRIGIPANRIVVHPIEEFPVTSSGKPDSAALVAHHRALAVTASDGALRGPVTAERVREVLAVCTGRPDATTAHSFSSLGGDSLSYVEASVRLEDLLGRLPRDWPSLDAVELASAAVPAASSAGGAAGQTGTGADPAVGGRRRRRRSIESPILLRAVAIVLIVGTHADLFLGDGFSLKGGAHLLLIVAGYNLARFALAPVAGARSARLLGALAQVAVPAVVWIAAVGLVSGKYTAATALMLNNAVPSDGRWSEQWQFWFLEAMVWSMVALAALFTVPVIDRLERSRPWLFALAVLAITVGIRFGILGFASATHVERYALPTVLWCLALGWVIARADTAGRRLLASALVLLLVPGFFGEPLREAIIAAGVLAVIWFASVPLPGWLRPVVTTLASASLFVYLTHWVVYPPFEDSAPLAGTLLSFAVGIAAWLVHRQLSAVVRRMRARLRGRRSQPALVGSGRG